MTTTEMKKQYFVNYYRDFGNTYTLRWADNAADAEMLKTNGYERITRRKALELAREENDRRERDYNFSGYADNRIYPANYDAENDTMFETDASGYIIIG